MRRGLLSKWPEHLSTTWRCLQVSLTTASLRAMARHAGHRIICRTGSPRWHTFEKCADHCDENCVTLTTPAGIAIARSVRMPTGRSGLANRRCRAVGLSNTSSVVLTVPEQIAQITSLYNKETVYGLPIRFKATAQNAAHHRRGDRRRSQRRRGFFAVLHRHGDRTCFHITLICTVHPREAASSPDHERWIACRPGYFLTVEVLSPVVPAVCFSKLSSRLLKTASWSSSENSSHSPKPPGSNPSLHIYKRPNERCMRSRHGLADHCVALAYLGRRYTSSPLPIPITG